MVDGSRIEEFRAHWNREPNSTQDFVRFRARVFETARQLWERYFKDSSSLRERFAVVSGTTYSMYPQYEQGGLHALLKSAQNVFEVAESAQYLLWTLEGAAFGAHGHCCDQLQRTFDLSPGILIRLARHGNTATIYPAGAKLLDDSLIQSNLAWLARYPQVLRPFQEALRLYMEKDPNKYRNMLDDLRVALEQMVLAVMKNEKSLEKQKEEFLRWLKQHDIHVQIGNMYHDLLFGGFTAYQNEAVKHKEDQYTIAEVEFMLYATGTFLRLIQRVAEDEGFKINSKSE